MDRTETIIAYQDRIYRLALFVIGRPSGAARAVERAFAGLRPAETDAEDALIRALLPARPSFWGWRLPPGDLPGLTPAERSALAAALASATPAARLALGARYLLGAPLPSAPPTFPAPDTSWPRRATDEQTLLAILARTLGGLPSRAGFAETLEQIGLRAGTLPDERAAELRAVLLADGEAGERARAIRDAVQLAETRLQAILPALFAAPAPPALSARMLRRAAPRKSASQVSRAARLQIGLVAVVGLLVATILLFPRDLLRRPDPPAPAAAAPAIDPAALVERALNRFEASEARGGVLHERYQVELRDQRWVVERWYGLSAPNPMRIEIRDAADQVLFAIASDGTGLVQRRQTPERDMTDIGAVRGNDYSLDEESLRRMMPILRRQPDGLNILGGGFMDQPYALDRYYLAQAYATAPTDFGAATVAGRPARLVAYRSPAPLPPPPDQVSEENTPASPSSRVVLAIDLETYALLEVRLLPDSDESAGEVRRPWVAESHEILATPPAGLFSLPPPEKAEPDTLLVSPRLPGAPPGALLNLSEALSQTSSPIFLPAPPAAPTLGYVVDMEEMLALVREGEHEVLVIMPFDQDLRIFGDSERIARQAGDRAYDLIQPPGIPATFPVSLATVYLGDDGQSGVHLIYIHSYADQAEREAQIDRLVRELQPLSPERFAELAPDF